MLLKSFARKNTSWVTISLYSLAMFVGLMLMLALLNPKFTAWKEGIQPLDSEEQGFTAKQAMERFEALGPDGRNVYLIIGAIDIVTTNTHINHSEIFIVLVSYCILSLIINSYFQDLRSMENNRGKVSIFTIFCSTYRFG